MKSVFKRPGNERDEVGNVQIHVSLRERGKWVRGNISKTQTIPGARVSEVWAVIEKALFGSESPPGEF